MESIRLDIVSLMSLKVETYFNDQKLGEATAFVIQSSGKHFLVTNRHVLSGRNPETNKCLNPNGAIPNRIGVWLHTHSDPNIIGRWSQMIINLAHNDGNSTWLGHPDNTKIDIAVVKLPDRFEGVTYFPIKDTYLEKRARIDPSNQVCVVGFPAGIAVDGQIPIWKTGHVASDYDIAPDGLPYFLIDATTKSGMSGSPVFMRSIGGYIDPLGKLVSNLPLNQFLGVYSGRSLSLDSEKIEVGRVWKSETIFEIINLWEK